MNRAAVDEEDQCEILKIFELEKASQKMVLPSKPENEYLRYSPSSIKAKALWFSQLCNQYYLDNQREQKGTVFFEPYHSITNPPS